MKIYLKAVVILVLSILPIISNAQVISVSVSQVDTFAIKGLPDQPVLKFKINTGTSTAFTLQRIVIKSLCDNNTDIQKVKIYKTTNDRFSKSDYPTESTALIEGGLSLDGDTAVFNLSYALAAGDNYFWMAYDLSSTSNPGNKLDASIRTGGITINGTNYVTSLQSPAGSSVIRQRYFFSSFEEFESESPHKPKGWVVVNPGGGKEATWESVKGGVSTASPTDPKSGQYNARSNYDDEIGYVSYLIAPLDLSLATKPKLTFYHAQSYRKYTKMSDSLGLYYGFSINGPWTFVKNYTLPTPDNAWLKREIDLPDEMVTNNVFFAFKSTAQYGDGVCLDSVTIYESTVATRKIKSVTCSHPESGMAPQGSRKNPILRLDIGVQGNEGDLYCSSITVNSLNTSDEDIVANGVGLYATRDSVFVSPTLLKTGSFSSGKATFNGFNVKLESGYNYFWVTYDIKRDAIPDNVIDAKIEVGDIVVSDGLPHPTVELSPAGNRVIEQAIFFDDFEDVAGWSLEGDFEIGVPQGKGVDNVYSFPDPSVAYSLSNVLGTDLSEDGNYGRNLRSLAISPLISCKYFKNTYLNYARWLNSEDKDSAVIEYQYEGESKWNEFWSTTSTINEGAWSIHNGSVKNLFDRKKFRMRFRQGTTDNLQDFSGWNIDYFFISGDSIDYDAAITDYLGPFSSCGLSSAEKIKIKIKNTGPQTLSNIPLKLSLDGGKSWIDETMAESINIDESKTFEFSPVDLSKAKIYNVIVKVVYPGDDYSDNDSLVYDLTSVPTYTLPYYNGFEKDTTFWLTGGINPSWVKGKPVNFEFSSVYEGDNCWKTGLDNNNYFENSYVLSPCFNLSDVEKPIVDFQAKFSAVPNISGARMEYSLDGGDIWNYVPYDSEPFNWKWYNDSIKQFHDKTKGWTEKFDVSWLNEKQVIEATGNKNLARFRFVYKADSAATSRYPGFAFDAFNLRNAPHHLGVKSIDNVYNAACQYGTNSNPEKLQITVENFGIRKVRANDSIIIGIKINKNPVVIDTFKLEEDLEVGATKQFTMTKAANVHDPGTYAVKAFVINKFPSYYGVNKDTISKAITVYPNPVTTLIDTISTAVIDTVVLRTQKDLTYTYLWKYNGSEFSGPDTLEAKNTGFGEHTITVSENVNNCKTLDTTFIKRLIQDAGVASIISPTNDCGYKKPLKPVITLMNYGTDTMSIGQKIPVQVKLNKAIYPVEYVTLTSRFKPDSVITVTLTTELPLLEAKTDTLKIWTDLITDDTEENDTTTVTFDIWGYPSISLGDDVSVEGQLSYELDAGSAYSSWKWNDGLGDTQKFTVTKPGDYWVEVSNAKGCVNSDTVHVHLKIHDLSIKLASPWDTCALSSATPIICQLKNTGTDTIKITEPITIGYLVNGGTEFTENITLATELKPNDSIKYTFAQSYDMAAVAVYNFQLKSVLADDIQPLNDSYTQSVEVFGNPVVDLGIDRIIKALTYTIDPGTFTSYKWGDGSTDPVWTITKEKYASDYTYSVTVYDEHGCSAKDEAVLYLLVNDLEVTDVILPRNSCSLSEKEIINIKVTNVGNGIIDKDIPTDISYSLNGSAEVTQRLAFKGAIGSTAVYTFETPVNMKNSGIYSFKATVKMDGDVNPENDTATFVTRIVEYPVVGFKDNSTEVVKLPYTIHAGPGYTSYKWQDNSTDSVFTVTTDCYLAENPIFSVIVDNGGCSVYSKITIILAKSDLAIEGIDLPSQSCTLPSGKFNITLKNNSTIALSNEPVTLGYSVDGMTWVSKEATINLAVGATQAVEFDYDEDLAPPATHTLNATLTFTSDEELSNNTRAFEIKVNGNPSFSLSVGDTVRTGSLPYAIDAGEGYKSYEWNGTAGDRIMNAPSEGMYVIKVTDNNDCSAKDSVYVKNTTSNGWLEEEGEISLYPNPVSNYLYVTIQLDERHDLIIDILTPEGKVVYAKKLENSAEYRDDIDVSGLPKGMYYVRIYTQDSMSVKKIVVR